MAYRVCFAAAVAVCSFIFLSACSASQGSGGGAAASEPESASVAEAPAAFHFESGDLVLGPFEPEDVLANPFHPCHEISDAEFKAAGFTKYGPIDEETSHKTGIFYCSMETDDFYTTNSIMINAANKEILLAQADPISEYSSELIPEAIALPGQDGLGNTCYVGVETSRGFFTAVAGDNRTNASWEQTCPRAIEILEKFYRLGPTEAAF